MVWKSGQMTCPTYPYSTDGIKPVVHYSRVGSCAIRQLYSVRKDRFGMTLSPAKRASPSSSTELMTWLWRAFPKSFSTSNDRIAHPTGINFDPGNELRVRRAFNFVETSHEEQEQTAKLDPHRPGLQIEHLDVSNIGYSWAWSVGTLIV